MKKPVETLYYTFDTTNPCKNQRGCDCVVRSISLAMDKTWDEVFDDLCVIAKKLHRMPSDDKVYEKYLDDCGWKCIGQPKKEDNTKYSIKEFIKNSVRAKTCSYVINVNTGHVSCIKNKKVHDVWDCTERYVGKVWIKNV